MRLGRVTRRKFQVALKTGSPSTCMQAAQVKYANFVGCRANPPPSEQPLPEHSNTCALGSTQPRRTDHQVCKKHHIAGTCQKNTLDGCATNQTIKRRCNTYFLHMVAKTSSNFDRMWARRIKTVTPKRSVAEIKQSYLHSGPKRGKLEENTGVCACASTSLMTPTERARPLL